MAETGPRSGGPGRLAVNALVAAGSLVVFLGLAEIVTRLFGGIGYGGWGDPASIHRMAKQFYANSRGLRDREFPYEKAPAEFRILCLGDSFTWGQMVPANTAYPKLLERLLAERGSMTRYSVMNPGQLGWSTIHEADWLRREGVYYNPNVILVGFFLNDAEVNHYEIEPLLPKSIEKRLGGSYFYFFLKYRVHMLRVRFGLAESYGDYLTKLYEPRSVGWRACRAALSEISATARSIDARVLVLILPAIQDWRKYPFAPIHEKVAGYCAEQGIPVTDLLDGFRSAPLSWKELRVGPNDDHPNAEGHTIIAEEALAALDRLGMLR
jgi:lysophospholipase L1-like esterase